MSINVLIDIPMGSENLHAAWSLIVIEEVKQRQLLKENTAQIKRSVRLVTCYRDKIKMGNSFYYFNRCAVAIVIWLQFSKADI
jgi:predicted protein tyrosine phosphatase